VLATGEPVTVTVPDHRATVDVSVTFRVMP
jgi:hypothetical protein